MNYNFFLFAKTLSSICTAGSVTQWYVNVLFYWISVNNKKAIYNLTVIGIRIEED